MTRITSKVFLGLITLLLLNIVFGLSLTFPVNVQAQDGDGCTYREICARNCNGANPLNFDFCTSNPGGGFNVKSGEDGDTVYQTGGNSDDSDSDTSTDSTISGTVDLDILNFFGTTCLFEGQPKLDGSGECEAEESIANDILAFLVNLGTIVASIALMVAGYFLMVGKEVEGRKLLRNAIVGLILVLSLGTIIDVIERTFTESETDEIATINPILEIVQQIIQGLLLPGSVIVAAIFFVIGAYVLLTAGGNSQKVSKGWQYMRNALLGMILVFFSLTIVQIIGSFATGFFG